MINPIKYISEKIEYENNSGNMTKINEFLKTREGEKCKVDFMFSYIVLLITLFLSNHLFGEKISFITLITMTIAISEKMIDNLFPHREVFRAFSDNYKNGKFIFLIVGITFVIFHFFEFSSIFVKYTLAYYFTLIFIDYLIGNVILTAGLLFIINVVVVNIYSSYTEK